MGSIFRRGFRCKQTGRRKRVKGYSLKYKDENGQWVVEATDIVRRPLAERLLHQRELEVERKRVGSATPPPADPAAPGSPWPEPPVALDILRHRYLAAVQLRLRESTCKLYQETLSFTLTELGAEGLGDLTPERIEDYARRRVSRGASARTVNIQISVLKRMLDWAAKQGLIPRSPIAHWQPLREKPARKRRAMLPDEARQLLAVSPLHRRVVYAVFLASGVRRGELLRLQIQDLDLERAILNVPAEISKTGRARRIFLPRGLVDLLREYLATDVRARPKRQEAYLARVRRRLAELEAAGRGDGPQAEQLRGLEGLIVAARGHQYLFVNGKGLPICRNCNLLREFRKDLRRAGIEPKGLDLHALRHTFNTVMLQGGVNPAVVRSRMGHTTARMTETYLDKEALDQGGGTQAIAQFLGVPDGEAGAAHEATRAGTTPGLNLPAPETLRPTPALLAALVERYSNIVIARICGVSEAAVRKWLGAAGLTRPKRVAMRHALPDWQIALLRADLRAALSRDAEGGPAPAVPRRDPIERTGPPPPESADRPSTGESPQPEGRHGAESLPNGERTIRPPDTDAMAG